MTVRKICIIFESSSLFIYEKKSKNFSFQIVGNITILQTITENHNYELSVQQ